METIFKTKIGFYELAKSFLVSFSFALIWFVFWNDYEIVFLVWAFCFFLSLTYFSKEKSMKKQKIAKQIESKLPFALLQIANDLESGIDFEKSIVEIAKNKDELAKSLQKAVSNHYSTGLPLDESILKEALKTASKDFLQAALRLSLVYRNSEGKKAGMPLRKMAFEILSKQKTEIREFMGKAQSISIGFIVASCVIPALLLAFAGIGSTFMEIPFTESQFFLITCIVIPIINMTAIAYVIKISPTILRRYE